MNPNINNEVNKYFNVELSFFDDFDKIKSTKDLIDYYNDLTLFFNQSNISYVNKSDFYWIIKIKSFIDERFFIYLNFKFDKDFNILEKKSYIELSFFNLQLNIMEHFFYQNKLFKTKYVESKKLNDFIQVFQNINNTDVFESQFIKNLLNVEKLPIIIFTSAEIDRILIKLEDKEKKFSFSYSADTEAFFISFLLKTSKDNKFLFNGVGEKDFIEKINDIEDMVDLQFIC